MDCESTRSNYGLPAGASYLMSVGRAEATAARVAMVAAVNFIVNMLV